MSSHRSAARKYGLRTAARRLNENSTPSSDPPQSPADTSNSVIFNSGGTDGRSRVRTTNNRSLPSPLDQIDPRRWKHFPRFSTTSDFATFPFSDIDVSEEEAHLSADEHSIIGIKTSLQEHGSQQRTLAVSTPETRIRSAAAGIRRAVSDSSDKIKRMTLKLRRAPSTLLSRSRSRVFRSQSPVPTQSGFRGLQYPASFSTRHEEAKHARQPFEGQFQQLGNLESKACKSTDQTNGDELSIASFTVTQGHTPSRIPPTTDADCEGQFVTDQEMGNASRSSFGQKNPTQPNGTSPLTRAEGLSDSQRNSLLDRLASYPQESLAWLAKDLLLNDSSVPMMDKTNTIFHELSGECQQDRSKVYSVASDMTNRPFLGQKMSLPEMDGMIMSDKPSCLPLTSDQPTRHGDSTRALGVYRGPGQIEQDFDDSPTAKHSIDLSGLFKNKTNLGYHTKVDEGSPTKAKPSLRRTVSRIFRGSTAGANNEN